MINTNKYKKKYLSKFKMKIRKKKRKKIFKRSCSVNQKDINYKIKKKYESNFIPYLYVYMSWLLMKMLLKKISNFIRNPQS